MGKDLFVSSLTNSWIPPLPRPGSRSRANFAEAEVKGDFKEGVPMGPGAKEAKLLCTTAVGWCKPRQEQRS